MNPHTSYINGYIMTDFLNRFALLSLFVHAVPRKMQNASDSWNVLTQKFAFFA
jgi:hypothetical protein